MTPTQKKRLAKLLKTIKAMGGQYSGRNSENYDRIARITSSSRSSVHAWVGGHRIIPQSKLDLLESKLS